MIQSFPHIYKSRERPLQICVFEKTYFFLYAQISHLWKTNKKQKQKNKQKTNQPKQNKRNI